MSADETRERILEKTWELVSRDGAGAVRMADVAGAAGVSRQMVYLHFADRAGLLTAVARWHDRRTGFLHEIADIRRREAVEALDEYVRAWWAYVRQILPVARHLYAGALTEGPGKEAYLDRMEVQRGGLTGLMGELDAAGRLAPGWTVQSAAEWAYGQLHIVNYLALIEECGWTHDEFVERSVRALHDLLVSE